MEELLRRPAAIVGIITLLVLALLGTQVLAISATPSQPVASTGKLLGTAGFAYLGGLRVFAAAVLWNRLEPQFHEFYQSERLEDLTFLMPSFYLVQRLDPSFVQAYYNAAFILAKRGQTAEAYRVAKEGIANNPTSGLMRANYIQLLLLENKQANLDKAYQQALEGTKPGTTYGSLDDEFESLAIFRTVFSLVGRADLVATTSARLDQLKTLGAEATGLSHDHDGDGKSDH